MRSRLGGLRLAVTAATVAATLVPLTGCTGVQWRNGTGPTARPSRSGTTGPAVAFTPGITLIADGTNVVTVGSARITFPTRVNDPSLSPNGARLAFIDGDGNVATSRPDGTDVVVLTQPRAGVVRSRPTWLNTYLVFAEKSGSGRSTLMSVSSSGVASEIGTADETSFTYALGFDQQAAPDMSTPSGSDFRMAFEAKSGSSGEVWVSDTNGRQPYAAKLANGTEPALSWDGQKVAYVARNGQISVVAADPLFSTAPVPTQVSVGVRHPSHLVWSSDGSRIVFETDAGVSSVAAPGHATSNPVTQLSAVHGEPTVLSAQTATLVDVASADPVGTAIAYSRRRYQDQSVYAPRPMDPSSASAAYLIGLSAPAAALPQVTTTGLPDGPLLFTSSDSLDPRTQAELRRILGSVPAGSDPPTITLVGNDAAISATVEHAVTAMGYHAARTGAGDPREIDLTAIAANQVKEVWVVSSDDPTGLVRAVGGLGTGRLIAVGGALSPAEQQSLNAIPASVPVYALDPEAYAAVSAPWPGKPALNITSPTTAQQLGLFQEDVFGHLMVADSSSPSDVVLAESLAWLLDGDALLVDSKAGLDPAVQTWLRHSAGSINTVYVVGPGGAFAAGAEKEIGAAISGPLARAIQ
jgi:hypothetical protein